MQRREFLSASHAAIAMAGVSPLLATRAQALAALDDMRPAAPDTAFDEAYWDHVRSFLHVDADAAWLAHGAGGATPAPVVAFLNYCAAKAATGSWDVPEFSGLKESGSSPALRQLIADAFGATPAEIALTRNTMEALATCMLGLDLRPGDEIVTTSSDYDSCISILRQREARDGVKVRLVDLPVPLTQPQEALAALDAAINSRTRLLLVSHMTYGVGQILPVRDICALARRRGVFTLVDGAHSVGHFAFRIDDIGCDAFAGSLHKWFMGPRGSGFLYLRRAVIRQVWPLFAPYSGKAVDDIEKFEESGTVSKAVGAALPLSFAFHHRIGSASKEARLRALRQAWTAPLERAPRVRFWTHIDEAVCCGVAAFAIDGMEASEMVRLLRERHGLRVRSLGNPHLPQVRGVNVGMTLVNSIAQASRLAEAVAEILRSN